MPIEYFSFIEDEFKSQNKLNDLYFRVYRYNGIKIDFSSEDNVSELVCDIVKAAEANGLIVTKKTGENKCTISFTPNEVDNPSKYLPTEYKDVFESYCEMDDTFLKSDVFIKFIGSLGLKYSRLSQFIERKRVATIKFNEVKKKISDGDLPYEAEAEAEAEMNFEQYEPLYYVSGHFDLDAALGRPGKMDGENKEIMIELLLPKIFPNDLTCLSPFAKSKCRGDGSAKKAIYETQRDCERSQASARASFFG